MPQTPLYLEPSRLTAVADLADLAADAIAGLPAPWPCPAELPGSAVALATGPADTARRLERLHADIRDWAASARAVVAAFGDTDRGTAVRIAGQ